MPSRHCKKWKSSSTTIETVSTDLIPRTALLWRNYAARGCCLSEKRPLPWRDGAVRRQNAVNLAVPIEKEPAPDKILGTSPMPWMCRGSGQFNALRKRRRCTAAKRLSGQKPRRGRRQKDQCGRPSLLCPGGRGMEIVHDAARLKKEEMLADPQHPVSSTPTSECH
jgi:hypothetical protein